MHIYLVAFRLVMYRCLIASPASLCMLACMFVCDMFEGINIGFVMNQFTI